MAVCSCVVCVRAPLCSCMLFVMMEQLTGGTLHDKLREPKRPTATQVFDWILQVLRDVWRCREAVGSLFGRPWSPVCDV